MNCEAAVRESMAEKYVLGRLDAAGTERFEQHFFDCDRCFLEVRTLQALQAGMREAPPGRAAGRRPGWWRPAHTWAWAAAAAIILGLAGASRLWVFQNRTPGSSGARKEAGAAGAAGEPSRSARLSELAAIEPPVFTPSLLRGVESRADGKFREAMMLYREGRYEAAIAGLMAAAGADRRHAGSRFFLGICFLMTGKPERARQVFQEAAALGDTPYLEPACFYLAKAHLRLNQVASARRELEKVIGLRGDLEASARKLLTELQAIVPAGGG